MSPLCQRNHPEKGQKPNGSRAPGRKNGILSGPSGQWLWPQISDLSLNLRLEMHILPPGHEELAGLLRLREARTRDGTPGPWGGGGVSQAVTRDDEQRPPQQVPRSPALVTPPQGWLPLAGALPPPWPHVLLCLHSFHFSLSADRPPGLTHLLQNGRLGLYVPAPG